MSFWKDYIKEKHNKEMIEDETGFAGYTVFSNGEFYVEDFYIKPELRKKGRFVGLVRKLCKLAEENNCDRVSSCVFLKANNPEQSLMWLLGMGFKIATVIDDKLFLYIKIEEYLKHEL